MFKLSWVMYRALLACNDILPHKYYLIKKQQMLQTVMGVISHFHCAIFSHPLTLLSNNDRRIRGETQRSEMQSSNMPTTSRPPSETISLAKVSK